MLYGPSVGDQPHLSGQLQTLIQVMRDQQDWSLKLFPHLPQDGVQIRAESRIEPGCRFIEQQQLGIADQGTRNRAALTLPTRYRRRQPSRRLGQTKRVEHFVHTPMTFQPGQALCREG